jgi:hypothetical protein
MNERNSTGLRRDLHGLKKRRDLPVKVSIRHKELYRGKPCIMERLYPAEIFLSRPQQYWMHEEIDQRTMFGFLNIPVDALTDCFISFGEAHVAYSRHPAGSCGCAARFEIIRPSHVACKPTWWCKMDMSINPAGRYNLSLRVYLAFGGYHSAHLPNAAF